MRRAACVVSSMRGEQRATTPCAATRSGVRGKRRAYLYWSERRALQVAASGVIGERRYWRAACAACGVRGEPGMQF
jgi:hypothetical protein